MSFKDFRGALAHAWSGETAKRLADAERRLCIIDGQVPNAEGAEVGGLLGELRDHLQKTEPKPKMEWKPSPFNGMVSVFLLMLFAGFFVFGRSKKDGDMLEYFSYVAPLAAGFIAGVGLYKRKLEAWAYMTSVMFLVAALFAFLKWKSQLFNVVYDLLGFLGLLVAMWLVWIMNRPSRNGQPRKDWEPLLGWFLFVVSIGMACGWALVMATSEPDWVALVARRVLTHLNIATINATPNVTERNAMQNPSGVARFCSLDDFVDMDYLRSKCSRQPRGEMKLWNASDLKPKQTSQP
jgi:hypothetical protein